MHLGLLVLHGYIDTSMYILFHVSTWKYDRLRVTIKWSAIFQMNGNVLYSNYHITIENEKIDWITFTGYST